MKTIAKFAFVLLGLVFVLSSAQAQDYKHPGGMINAEGKVFSPDGKHIGWVTKEGIIKDVKSVQVAHVDSEGTLVDKSGKKLGKAQKNGNYLAQDTKTSDKGWTVSAPMNGTCDVKNEKGEIVVVVHESYKQFGACAYHCLYLQKEGKAMKMD